MYCLIFSVVGGVEVRPLLGDLGRALFSIALLVFRGHPGVASWLALDIALERPTKFEGGLNYELAPPGVVLRQGNPVGEGRLAAGRLKWARSR